MLTRNQPFAPAGDVFVEPQRRLSLEMRHRNEPPMTPDPHTDGAIP